MSVGDGEVEMALEGDIWLVQESEQHVQKNFYNIVCGLVNDAQDVWVKGPAEMGEAFLNM